MPSRSAAARVRPGLATPCYASAQGFDNDGITTVPPAGLLRRTSPRYAAKYFQTLSYSDGLWMVGPERFFRNPESTFKKRLSLRVAAQGKIDRREVVEDVTDIRMLRAQCRFGDLQGALV